MQEVELLVKTAGQVERVTLKVSPRTSGLWSVWWERTSPSDRAAFAKYASLHCDNDVNAAWNQLGGDTWCSSYRKTATAEDNPLLQAIQAQAVDAEDGNAIDLEQDDDDDYNPPVQQDSVPVALLEDLDEDLV